MKIGTLTILLPLNYGNALQMLALQRFIEKYGITTALLRRKGRLADDECFRWHAYCRRSMLNRIVFALTCLTFTGKFCAYLREARLLKWLLEHIRFDDAIDLPDGVAAASFPYDKVVVGSDQVWHSKSKEKELYMLSVFPDTVKRIAYAASFDKAAFPVPELDFYANQFKRFTAVSVRESSSVAMFQERFGFKPAHVCDPTLLHTRDEWCSILGIERHRYREKFNVCYIVSAQGASYYPDLLSIARRTGVPLHVFAYDCAEIPLRGENVLKVSFKALCMRLRMYFSGIRLHFAATPTEFVQRIADCECVFTDSFHGMMFATIFEKKCNVIVGGDEERQAMQAKLVDFVSGYWDDGVLSRRFNPDALGRLMQKDKLSSFISSSAKWLLQAIGSVDTLQCSQDYEI